MHACYNSLHDRARDGLRKHGDVLWHLRSHPVMRGLAGVVAPASKREVLHTRAGTCELSMSQNVDKGEVMKMRRGGVNERTNMKLDE